ncbi:tetratricopeptide repeat protein [Polyangium spumosum]|uniref:Tetratricopeptide repeat protein n=1 Tax=Polyangium spumosum TaxID=889282 RepID=A0A6N7PQ11_9BACT|nr:tetratricopeptide repeat protein [Polyangium spumosum]
MAGGRRCATSRRRSNSRRTKIASPCSSIGSPSSTTARAGTTSIRSWRSYRSSGMTAPSDRPPAVLREPEALLGEEDGAAFRRFVDWSVEGDFSLAIVEVTTPWKRDALLAWTQAKVPRARAIALHWIGPSKERLWALLEEAQAAGASALILHRLEEAEHRSLIIAQLNVQRDELVKAFPMMWILLVHPEVGRELQMKAPDFVDFGFWLWEEKPEPLREMLATIDAPGVMAEPAPVGEVGAGDLLRRAIRAIRFRQLDEAADLLAQLDMHEPEARETDPRRRMCDAFLAGANGRYEEAREHLRTAREAYEARGDRAGRAWALHQLAIIEERQGRYEEARKLLRESVEVNEELGDRAGRAASLHQLSIIEERQGRYEEARKLLEESIVVTEEIGNRVGRAASLHQLASIEYRQGHYEEARKLLEESIAVREELGDRAGRAASLHQLASIEFREGRYEEARKLLEESIGVREELGDRAGRAASLHQLALIEFRQGRYEEARKLLEESIGVLEEIGNRAGLALSLVMLGQLEVTTGRVAKGRQLVQQGVDILQEIGSGDLPVAQQILADIDALLTPPEPSTA